MKDYSINVFYQPIVSIDKGKTVGLEALMRAYKNGVQLPTYETIQLAERQGYIEDVSFLVFRKALYEFKNFNTENLFINISPKLLENKTFPEVLKKMYFYNPHNLICEITESDIPVDMDLVIYNIKALKNIGFRLALDDYDTGISKAYIDKGIPFDIIKLSRELTLQAFEDICYVREIVKALKENNHIIIAEGIETINHKQLMYSCGCSHFQGFLFGKPSDKDSIIDTIQKSTHTLLI